MWNWTQQKTSITKSPATLKFLLSTFAFSHGTAAFNIIAYPGASGAKRKWYGLEKMCARDFFGQGVSLQGTLQSRTAGTAKTASNYILRDNYNCVWIKKWYGHGCTGHHGSDAPDTYDVV